MCYNWNGLVLGKMSYIWKILFVKFGYMQKNDLFFENWVIFGKMNYMQKKWVMFEKNGLYFEKWVIFGKWFIF